MGLSPATSLRASPSRSSAAAAANIQNPTRNKHPDHLSSTCGAQFLKDTAKLDSCWETFLFLSTLGRKSWVDRNSTSHCGHPPTPATTANLDEPQTPLGFLPFTLFCELLPETVCLRCHIPGAQKTDTQTLILVCHSSSNDCLRTSASPLNTPAALLTHLCGAYRNHVWSMYACLERTCLHRRRIATGVANAE